MLINNYLCGNLLLIKKTVQLILENKTVLEVSNQLQIFNNLFYENNNFIESYFNLIYNKCPYIAIILSLIPKGIDYKIFSKLVYSADSLSEHSNVFVIYFLLLLL